MGLNEKKKLLSNGRNIRERYKGEICLGDDIAYCDCNHSDPCVFLDRRFLVCGECNLPIPKEGEI